MNNDVIPNHVKQFLLKHIDSIAQWEGLLLLRAQREMMWTKEQVARNLYLNETEAARLLSHLCSHGFVATSKSGKNPIYTYQPKSEELRQLVDETSDLYKHYLIPITHLIHSKSKSRIQEFADAFLIRKD